MPEWNPQETTSNATSGNAQDDLDVALMMRVKQGDTRAFEQLVELHQRGVIGTVTRMLNNVDDAHDVAQQVFVRVWRSAERYEASAKFTTWLYTITKNLVFNELRRRGRKKEFSIQVNEEDQTWEFPTSPDTHPDALALQEEMERAIDEAINSLPEKQRLAVSMRRFQDSPYEDIAEVLNMSLSAVKSLIFRARNDLRNRLAKYLDDEV